MPTLARLYIGALVLIIIIATEAGAREEEAGQRQLLPNRVATGVRGRGTCAHAGAPTAPL